MASRYDIGLNNNDLLIQDGDFTILESDEQHIIDNIGAFPGWWKQYPNDGVGIVAYQKGNADIQQIQKVLRLQLSSDGYNVTKSTVTLSPEGKLTINPNATI